MPARPAPHDGSARTAVLPAPTAPPEEALVVVVTGEVDLATAAHALGAVDLAPTAASPVVLDLAGVSFIDCAGLGELLLLRRLLLGQGRQLRLRSPSPVVTHLLAWTATEGHFETTPAGAAVTDHDGHHQTSTTEQGESA